jgi:hypothetical protein
MIRSLTAKINSSLNCAAMGTCVMYVTVEQSCRVPSLFQCLKTVSLCESRFTMYKHLLPCFHNSRSDFFLYNTKPQNFEIRAEIDVRLRVKRLLVFEY